MEPLTEVMMDRLTSLEEKIDKILVQTTKTNGRVDRIEEWRKSQSKLLWWGMGIVATVIILFIQKYIS
jgi:hypothetical protein